MAFLVHNGKYVIYNGKYVTNVRGDSSDSISAYPNMLEYFYDGTPFTTSETTITSSGNWTRSYIDTGDGVSWVKGLPATGVNQDICNILILSAFTGPGDNRSCIVRFTVGTASYDVTIIQWSNA
jgi:hypothetical protein